MKGAVLRMPTNLPEGTIVYYTTNAFGDDDYVASRFARVGKRMLTLRAEATCGDTIPKTSPGRGFEVAVMVVPDQSQVYTGPNPDCVSSDRCGANQLQPKSVLEILGHNFEKLAGGQVTTVNDTRALVDSAHYAWPAGVCAIPIDPSTPTPKTCPFSNISINDEAGGSSGPNAVVSFIGPIARHTVCDLYSYGTDRFRRRTPWPDFRDRVEGWIKAHAPFAMDWKITSQSTKRHPYLFDAPEWVEADYFMRGTRAGHVRFILVTRYPGYTRYEMDSLSLF
jgi:hypothetical protein